MRVFAWEYLLKQILGGFEEKAKEEMDYFNL
jgi:hypothetical protein